MVTRKFAAVSTALAAVVVISGCSAAREEADGEIHSSTQIIDVRTLAEFEVGHLEGSVNIDLRSADFDAAITKFPLDGNYIVYCASGNRSAVAVDRMTELGFDSIIDAGGVSEAADATGIDIVTE